MFADYSAEIKIAIFQSISKRQRAKNASTRSWSSMLQQQQKQQQQPYMCVCDAEYRPNKEEAIAMKWSGHCVQPVLRTDQRRVSATSRSS